MPWSQLVRWNEFRNLGLGTAFASIFTAAFFAAEAAMILVINISFGPRAFFMDGLRVVDWKHGKLSTGGELAYPSQLLMGFSTLVFWVAFIFCAEIAAGIVRFILQFIPPWVFNLVRLAVGSCFISFGVWFCGGAFVIHPTPFTSIVGGAIIFWNGIKGIFGPLMGD